MLIFINQNTFAACGGTVRTWAGVNTLWNTSTNWSGNNVPDTAAEDVVITSTGFNANFATSYTLGCVDVQSGTINGSTAGITMTITGDYFQAPYQNSLNITNNSFVIAMAGSSPQTFEAVDDIRDLKINNPTSVTLKNNFRILSNLALTGSGTTIIEGTVQASAAISIPVGHTVIIKNGGALYSAGNLTVLGTLQIEGGGQLQMANLRTLSIRAGAALQLMGSAGNAAIISSSNSASHFTFNVIGTVSSNYAVIQRPALNGMNVTGTIFQLDHTDFRGMVTTGYGLTLGAAAVVPSTLDTIGFFNDDAVATPYNINANAYNLSAVTVNNTSGDISGASYELDPNSKINWGSSAPTELNVTNNAAANEPTSTLAKNTTITFADFALSLNQSGTSTDITQVILTMTGTATMSDLASVQVYADVNANCTYDAGTDTQIGSNLVFAGSPLTATISIPAGLISTNAPTQKGCLIVRATSGASPVDQHTLGFGIVSSSDISNSQNYSISSTSGTPIYSRSTILINTTYSTWSGASSTAWNTAANWSPATVPNATRDCKIGLATNMALINVNPIRCANATLQTNGTLDFNSAANIFEVSHSIDVSSGFNFLNAANGGITMNGSVNQAMSFSTAFPGNVIINNTGVVGNNTVTVGADSTINGNLTCTSGVLDIPSGITLTVLGTVTVQTGCTLSVGAGGTLALANNKTLTVDSGGTLQMLGTSGSKALMTSVSGTAAYDVVVNGTIKAQYYSFDHLNTAGVSIEAVATIDSTNYLQDGTFSYPVNSSSTLLKLKRQIPGNALSNMTFASNSSGATNIVNIDTTGAAAGTLTITNYSGSLSGSSFETAPSYLINWTGQLNTIAITQEATSPASVLTGTTNNMGRFGFQQVSAGASYQDADITTLSLSLTGTGTATDVDSVRLYSDAGCTGSGGTLIGTGTFSGSPAKVTFTIAAGALVVPAALITTSKVCAYVEFDIAPGATNGSTVGVKLNASSDIVNSKNYPPSAGTSFPVTLGTASSIVAPTTTTWTGTTSTAWATASNWTAGVPTSAVNCTIPNVANDPIISTGTGSCKDINITNGILVINSGTFLDIYGNFTKTGGTLTNNGTLSIKDGGSNIDHNLFSNSTMTNLTLAKTGTGTVFVNQSSLTITTLNFSSATTTLEIPSGNKLVLPNGVTLSQGILKIAGGGTLELANTKTLTISGGTFLIAGTSDGFPQNLATKGVVQVTGGGANSYNITATSGTLDLTGFQFDRIGVNGLNIGGTTTVANLKGGQFTNLSTTYASVKAIQLNNSGAIPATATNIAWTWGAFNSFNPANGGTPTSAQAYKLISSTGCSNHTIDFTGWTGDWYESQATFDVSTKVSATNCSINLGASASAVSILFFNAVPFNKTIDLRWQTNAERTHLGFNVYRADMYSAKYVQVNKSLIRNLKNSGSNSASYRFIDQDVENNKTYFYYIEDVETNGKKVLHGPVSASPLSTLGTPPADNSGENSQTNPDDPTNDGGSTIPSPAPIPNPSYEDLGNGIVILEKTSKSIRLEITPANPVFSVSGWNNSYQDVAIAGYSKMTTVGKPELPEKDILIEVQSYATNANLINATVTESILASHLISPAPNYTLNGSGVLVPGYSPDATTYASSSNYPANFYAVQTALVAGNNSKFLKIKIDPLKLNPVTQSITMASKIILDIGLDGDDWDVNPPDVNSNIEPYSVSNVLRIDFEKDGIYQINYEDFINSQVDGPFKNTPINQWRLYYKNLEIPLEIYSANGTFSPGDYVRFYVPFTKEIESKKNQLILSPVNITSSNSIPMRMETLEANPSNQTVSDEVLTKFTKTLESNLKYIDGVTLDDSLDHFFYADLVNFAGMDTLTVTAALPEIDVNNSENVIVNYHVHGRLGMLGNPVKHSVRLSIAGNVEGESEFWENDRRVLSFEVPADRFVAGNNTLSFKVLGSFAPANDNDFVLVDKIEIIYNGFNYGASGESSFSLADTMRAHNIYGFPSNQILGYDITNPLEVKKLANIEVTTANGGTTYDAKFFVDGDVDEENLKHFSFATTGSVFKPTSLSLNPGIEESLKNSSNKADLIIYGDQSLILACEDLIERRVAQGLTVMTVTPEQVYGEFSYGIHKSSALKDFIQTALKNWEKAPKYLLILGDATYDPQDFNVGSLAANERSALEKATMPAPLIPGRFVDFSSDNYYVSSNVSHLPKLAVGRLPTNDPEKIKAYIEKIKKYEDGDMAPANNLKKITFFADEDTGDYENFNKRSRAMMSEAPGFSTPLFDRTELGSKAATKTKINEEFNYGPLMISMMGHGAFDRFGDDIFNVSDAALLNNSVLPIVAAWNCETSYFYDANKTYKSLGEELIFNPNGGAIVYIGSTTQTTPPAQSKLAQNFFSQFTEATKKPWTGVRFGDLLYQAKVAVGDGSYEKDIVNSFSIIGDPSLNLPEKLFPPASEAPKASSIKKGLFGCTANAGEDGANAPWHEGFLEWIFYMFLIILGTRKALRMTHE